MVNFFYSISGYIFFSIFLVSVFCLLCITLFIILRQRKKLQSQSLRLLAVTEEERFTLERARHFVYRLDTRGIARYVSASIERITGRLPQEWRAHYATFLTDNICNQKAIEYIEKALRAGEKPPVFELEMFHKNGRRIYLEMSLQPTREVGNVTGIAGIARDISERKEMERELAKAHELSLSIIKALPFGMDIVDYNGNILYASEKFIAAFGHDIIGKKCWILYRDDKKQCTSCPLIKGVAVGQVLVSEVGGVLDGKIFEITHVGLVFNGAPAVLEFFNDITEHKRIQDDLNTKVQALQRFQSVTIDRELKMKELKARIAELEEKLEKYT
ncbi:MAG: PAS domain S-box protein [Candidatus Omnitrophota bacterium]|nr:PAS domain S-box protein [Candidatus Omnitrophota bacterium]